METPHPPTILGKLDISLNMVQEGQLSAQHTPFIFVLRMNF